MGIGNLEHCSHGATARKFPGHMGSNSDGGKLIINMIHPYSARKRKAQNLVPSTVLEPHET